MSTLDDPNASAAAESAAREIMREILEAVDAIRSGFVISAIEQYILARDVARAVNEVGLQPLTNALARLTANLDPVREAAWNNAIEELPKRWRETSGATETLAAASVRDPALAQPLVAMDLSRITAISQETRAAIADVLSRGISSGTHPTILARQIKGIIGLTRRQALAVENYHARLTGAGRDTSQVERMTARYAKRLLTQRAGSIAATETARAQNDGLLARWQSLVRTGALASADWRVEFVTAHDERTCPLCAPLDGARINIGGTFATSVGPVAGPPLHPLCRCIVRLVRGTFRAERPTAIARDAILRRIGTLQSDVALRSVPRGT